MNVLKSLVPDRGTRRPYSKIMMVSSSNNDNAAAASAAAAQHAKPETIRRPLRVLVVEDEAIIAMYLEGVLDDLHVEVVGVAASADEALRLARLHRPDFATMDINLKGKKDGISAATDLYRDLGIRSIYLSAYGNLETRTRAAQSNPYGWIPKPIDEYALETLLRTIRDG